MDAGERPRDASADEACIAMIAPESIRGRTSVPLERIIGPPELAVPSAMGELDAVGDVGLPEF